MQNLSTQDKALVEGLQSTYNEIEQSKIESFDKLADLWDPYSLVHEGYFYKEYV
jgi:hypothetical protein